MTEKAAKRKYTRLVKFGRKYQAYLQIDHQGFAVIEPTTKPRAEWFQDQLAKALARMLTTETRP